MRVVYKAGQQSGPHVASLSGGFAFGARGLRDDQMTDEVKEARKNRRINGRQAMLSPAHRKLRDRRRRRLWVLRHPVRHRSAA